MKKNFVLLLLTLFSSVVSVAQENSFDENGECRSIVEINATAKQIFQYSRMYLSSSMKDYANAKQIEDSEMQKIAVKMSKFLGDEPIKIMKNTNAQDIREHSVVTIDAKDGKMRIKVENPTFSYRFYSTQMNMYLDNEPKNNNYELFKDMVLDSTSLSKKRAEWINLFITNLTKYINKSVEEEDF